MRILAVALLACVSSTSIAHAQTLRDLLEQLKVTWNAPSEPFRVIGNVYYVGTAGLSSFLITSSQGHVLIDTGLPEANPQIKANIEKLGFKVADIRQLLNTHAHLDHTGGLAGLKKETGAQFAASAADKPLLEGGYYPGQESDSALNFPPVKVDRVVGEGDKVTIGDTTLTALMTPGHSPGCTTWTMTAKENGQGLPRDLLLQRVGRAQQAGRQADASRHRGGLSAELLRAPATSRPTCSSRRIPRCSRWRRSAR